MQQLLAQAIRETGAQPFPAHSHASLDQSAQEDQSHQQGKACGQRQADVQPLHRLGVRSIPKQQRDGQAQPCDVQHTADRTQSGQAAQMPPSGLLGQRLEQLQLSPPGQHVGCRGVCRAGGSGGQRVIVQGRMAQPVMC